MFEFSSPISSHPPSYRHISTMLLPDAESGLGVDGVERSSTGKSGSIGRSLKQLPVRDAIDNEQEVIALSSLCSIEKTLEELEKYDISAVPLVDKNSIPYCFVDMLDIVSFALTITNHTMPLEETDFLNLMAKEKCFKSTSVDNVADLSSRNPFIPISYDAPLLEAIQYFAAGNHRLPVFQKFHLVNIFTQSQFIRFLASHLELLGKLGHKTCLELDLGTLQHSQEELRPVVQIDVQEPALEAFRLMQFNNLSAIAVVNPDGSFCGQISGSDLKGIGTGDRDSDYTLRSLLLPLSQFLPMLRGLQNRDADFMVWISPSLSLNEIIRHMNKYNMHRVYVLKSHDGPQDKQKGKKLPPNAQLLGVVSITDIAKVLLQWF